MISVLINVFIFISVVSIVGSKLRVNVMKRSDFRYRLARSTLALLPLLGIHYVTTMFIKVGVAESRTNLHIVANFINAILTSVQGLLVSIIYCFCNAEVQVRYYTSTSCLYCSFYIQWNTVNDVLLRMSWRRHIQHGN